MYQYEHTGEITHTKRSILLKIVSGDLHPEDNPGQSRYGTHEHDGLQAPGLVSNQARLDAPVMKLMPRSTREMTSPTDSFGRVICLVAFGVSIRGD